VDNRGFVAEDRIGLVVVERKEIAAGEQRGSVVVERSRLAVVERRESVAVEYRGFVVEERRGLVVEEGIVPAAEKREFVVVEGIGLVEQAELPSVVPVGSALPEVLPGLSVVSVVMARPVFPRGYRFDQGCSYYTPLFSLIFLSQIISQF